MMPPQFTRARRRFTRWQLTGSVVLAITSPAFGQSGATFPLSVLVFYDENRNGVLDPGEDARLEGVAVTAAAQTARTLAGGVASLQVPAGEVSVAVETGSLPAYFEAPGAVTLSVPRQSQLVLPVTLPTGADIHPNLYMAFGDSITAGDGSSDGQGYRRPLEAMLRARLSRATVVREAFPGTQSSAGAEWIDASLRRQRPAYTLIHYGTNDWNAFACRTRFPCDTIVSLRAMVREAKAQGSLPILATILPTNVGYDARVPPERNDWLDHANQLIRQMAREEGCEVADLWAAFLAEGDLGRLFADHVHPNDAGYAIMARAFFEAITGPRAAAVPAVAAR